jgi:hypothetical protein
MPVGMLELHIPRLWCRYHSPGLEGEALDRYTIQSEGSVPTDVTRRLDGALGDRKSQAVMQRIT